MYRTKYTVQIVAEVLIEICIGNKAMKYKTLKDHLKPMSIGIMVLVVIGTAVEIYNSAVNPARVPDRSAIVFLTVIFIMALAYIAYCYSGNLRRKKYKKYGTRLDGYIESAQESFGGRGYNRYYLKISFHDERRRARYTEAYIENPCYVLKSRKCSVYKYKGKYLEGDFMIADKRSDGQLSIPVSKRRG